MSRFYNFIFESYMLYRQPAEKIVADLMKKRDDSTPPVRKAEIYLSANKDSLNYEQRKNLERAIEIMKSQAAPAKKAEQQRYFRNPGEAKLYLQKQHGVSVNGEMANLALMSYVADVFDKFKEKGIKLPKNLHFSNAAAHLAARSSAKVHGITPEKFHTIGWYFQRNRGANAFYDWSSDTIAFNGDRFGINSIEDRQQHQYNIGHTSVPDRDRTTVHELAHALHFYNLGSDSELFEMMSKTPVPFAMRQKIEKEVGAYSATSGLEFVAEVFTGMYFGKKYSKEVMDLYKEYDGPEVK